MHKLLQFQLKDLATYYDGKRDLEDEKFSKDDGRGGDRDRGRGGRDRDRGGRDRDGGRGRDRDFSSDRGGRDRDSRGGDRDSRGGGYKEGGRSDRKRRSNGDMVRFFFNLGKKDSLKKMDMLEIINNATKQNKKRPDIGDIEILDKFSFFEVEKDFKNEVLKNIQAMKFKGKDMRAEEAN